MPDMTIEKEEFVSFSTGDRCSIGDKVDIMWGSSYQTLSAKDMMHLAKNGIIRFIVCGEYNCFLKMEMEDETDD